MKVTGINVNRAFKGLYIDPDNETTTKNFLKQYENVVNKAAKNNDLFISSDNMVIERGSDYEILKPVINVAINPIEVDNGEPNGYKFSRNYNTIPTLAFSYIPSTENEKNGKFAETLEKTLSLIG